MDKYKVGDKVYIKIKENASSYRGKGGLEQ